MHMHALMQKLQRQRKCLDQISSNLRCIKISYTDLQKLLKLLLVASIVKERVDCVCIEGYISVVWKPSSVT